MKKSSRDLVVVSILSFVIATALLTGFVYMHELTHKVVYRSFNIKSHIGFDLHRAYTVPNQTDYSHLSDYEKLVLTLSQNIVEAIGYHLSMFFVLLVIQFVFFILICYIFLLFMERKMKNSRGDNDEV